MTLAPSEENLWVRVPKEKPEHFSDAEINARYIRGEGRIVIETNREKLPGFVSLLKQPNYMDLRPFYQRRPRWKAAKQSLLIESFIMNIPVPPVFLYERDYNSYEVMDGQQRITALREFYDGKFELEGLERWPEINGRTYQTLPDKIQQGLDRRSITSIVLLKESTTDEEEASTLRETVFDRLNTGGTKLSRQEIRNALYRGRMNELVDRLSHLPKFREAWGIPAWVENEIDATPGLLDNSLYEKMEDVELVLRFFALRHADHYSVGMQPFLDLYMRKAAAFNADDLEVLDREFTETLELAAAVYEDLLFRPYDPTANAWMGSPQKAFYDAVMVGMSAFLDRAQRVKDKAVDIRNATEQMFRAEEQGTFTGRGNTKDDIRTRIGLFQQMVERTIA
jgi:hypothetical protein